MLEAALFGAGHAVYAVPPGAKARDETYAVVVAWEDTRELARAVAEALPFLTRATNTRIVMVDGESDAGEAAIDIAAHLDRHGVNVEIVAIEAGERTVAQALIDEARKCRPTSS